MKDAVKGGADRPKWRRRLLVLAAVLAAIALFALSPLFPFVRSLAVMGVYSGMHREKSLMAEAGIDLDIPGGLETSEADWYPFTMTYVADEDYAAFSGDPGARLTILYNFPAFDYTRGCSRLYEAASPYYNSFYGAYLVRDGSNAALAAGAPEVAVVADIARFDFFTLVLGEFGLAGEARVFEYEETARQQDVAFAGCAGWTRMRADLTVNGSAHNRRRGVTSYLQYGAPGFGPVAREFAPVAMTGLIYARYFPEWDTGVYFYILASDEDVLRACDEAILCKSTIKEREA